MGKTIAVPFHGATLLVITDPTGTLVPLKPLVTGMGLDWSAQFRRIKRDLVLGPAIAMTATTASPAGDKDGICLPLDLVPGFLFKVDARRVAEAARPKVLDYQRECFRTLADACLGPQGRVADNYSRPEELPSRPVAALPVTEARTLVAECRKTFGLLQARELWFSIGLPRVPSMIPPKTVDLFAHADSRGGRA